MLDFHRGLIADDARTRAYQGAIAKVVRPGDVVLDLGAGTGILSFFACQAGARRVFAVEQSHAADAAAILVRQLGYGDRIEVFHTLSTTVELPEPANVLITETHGAFGLDGGIIASILDARARLLRTGARVIPRRMCFYIAPVMLPALYAERIAWWSDPHYELDLSSLRLFASNTLYSAEIEESALLGPAAEIMDLDLEVIETTSVLGRASLTVARDGVLHGFAAWFTSILAEGFSFTSRKPRETYWQQAFFPLQQPVEVSPETEIEVELQSDNGTVWRWLGTIECGRTISFDQMTWLNRPPCVRNER